MGAVISPGGSISYPWWCGLSDWSGGWSQACRPATPEQIRAAQTAEVGPGMTPGSVEAALGAGDVGVEAYRRLHPEEWQTYQEGQINWLPWIAATAIVVLLLTR
jgi:hypothetical protein